MSYEGSTVLNSAHPLASKYSVVLQYGTWRVTSFRLTFDIGQLPPVVGGMIASTRRFFNPSQEPNALEQYVTELGMTTSVSMSQLLNAALPRLSKPSFSVMLSSLSHPAKAEPSILRKLAGITTEANESQLLKAPEPIVSRFSEKLIFANLLLLENA